MKKRNTKIGLIGRIAEDVSLFDGQTITTRLFKKKLMEKYGEKSIYCVDIYEYRKHYIRCFLKSLVCLFRCKYIVIMFSKRGRKFYFPFFYYANRFFHRKIIHRLIGGELCNEIEKNPRFIRYLNDFEVNYVETKTQVTKLKNLGLTNIEETLTFRNSQIIKFDELPCNKDKPFIFCTFCRVTQKKGITTAIRAIEEINAENGDCARLDIYGPLDENYSDEFNRALNLAKGCVRYMGSIPYENSISTLKNYYMHIFPTVWPGEGLAGTLVDCFGAGLPTIATNWNYNAEVLTEGETGFCYEWEKPELLKEKILWCIQNPDIVNNMRYRCIQEAQKYSPDVWIGKVFERIS